MELIINDWCIRKMSSQIYNLRLVVFQHLSALRRSAIHDNSGPDSCASTSPGQRKISREWHRSSTLRDPRNNRFVKHCWRILSEHGTQHSGKEGSTEVEEKDHQQLHCSSSFGFYFFIWGTPLCRYDCMLYCWPTGICILVKKICDYNHFIL